MTIVLSTKPLQKLTGTDRQDRQADAQDYVLSQADALTKNRTFFDKSSSTQSISKLSSRDSDPSLVFQIVVAFNL